MRLQTTPTQPRSATSLLVVSDRLLSLAEDADRAGLALTAGQLVEMACAILDNTPVRH